MQKPLRLHAAAWAASLTRQTVLASGCCVFSASGVCASRCFGVLRASGFGVHRASGFGAFRASGFGAFRANGSDAHAMSVKHCRPFAVSPLPV